MNLRYNKKALSKIAKEYRLKFVILHGSSVGGPQRADSDTDVAVVPEREFSPEDFLRLYGQMSFIFGDSPERELDLKILYRADPLFRYEVVKKGNLLFGIPTDYEEYKAVSYRMFEDAKPLFELERLLSEKYQRAHLNKI